MKIFITIRFHLSLVMIPILFCSSIRTHPSLPAFLEAFIPSADHKKFCSYYATIIKKCSSLSKKERTTLLKMYENEGKLLTESQSTYATKGLIAQASTPKERTKLFMRAGIYNNYCKANALENASVWRTAQAYAGTFSRTVQRWLYRVRDAYLSI